MIHAPVRDVLAKKGAKVFTTAGTASVLEAIRQMTERHVGCLLVMAENGKLAGILSERDCFRKVILREKSPRDVPVCEAMTQKVQYVTLDRTVEECMALMTRARIRHLPVMEGDRVVGLISIGDLVEHLIAEQDFLIHNLEKYIEGTL